MTSRWPMKLMMRISPEHLAQTRGSVSYTLRIKWVQRLFNSLETGGGGGSVTWVGSSSTFSFFLFPLEALLFSLIGDVGGDLRDPVQDREQD